MSTTICIPELTMWNESYCNRWPSMQPFEELLLVRLPLHRLRIDLIDNYLNYWYFWLKWQGPTYCTQEILARNNLNLGSDIGVFEIHEAFAGQLLSNLVAMNSQSFADKSFGGKKVGEVDMSKLNTKGGSLALGHPFGATGSRLVTTASRRLQTEGQRFAIGAACADGGLGHAFLLERYNN